MELQMADELTLDDLEFTDEMLDQLRAAFDARKLKLEHPYVLDLIGVLARYPKCSRRIALDMLWRRRRDTGLSIPRTFEDSAQSALEFYCLDSDVFKKRGVSTNEALFCWPAGKGKGVWALLRRNAKQWVTEHYRSLPGRILNA
jgi:hypothetical protein